MGQASAKDPSPQDEVEGTLNPSYLPPAHNPVVKKRPFASTWKMNSNAGGLFLLRHGGKVDALVAEPDIVPMSDKQPVPWTIVLPDGVMIKMYMSRDTLLRKFNFRVQGPDPFGDPHDISRSKAKPAAV